MVLERENTYFYAHRDELIGAHEGQFVVIKDDRVLGSYPNYEAAFAAGIQEWGNQAFLIRQVLEHEEPAQFPALTVGLISAQLS